MPRGHRRGLVRAVLGCGAKRSQAVRCGGALAYFDMWFAFAAVAGCRPVLCCDALEQCVRAGGCGDSGAGDC